METKTNGYPVPFALRALAQPGNAQQVTSPAFPVIALVVPLGILARESASGIVRARRGA